MNPKKLKLACSTIQLLTDNVISYALSQRATKTTSDSQLEGKPKYVLLHELASKATSHVELRDQLLAMLLAGRDTTSALMSWAFYLLARHPSIYTKLRTAVLDDFGSDKDFDQDNFSFARLKSCKYLQYVLNEALRLFSVVPFNSRVASRDTVLPVGGGPDGTEPIAVKKGYLVSYCPYLMHRRKDIWGEDADEFRPERWIERKSGWEFIPFNGGPRICIGRMLSLFLCAQYSALWHSHFGGESTLTTGSYRTIRINRSLICGSATCSTLWQAGEP
jgi:cytochrome P450